MNYKQLLEVQIEHAYNKTDLLMDMVDEDKLNWKPSKENNWMSTGQLLKHITESCGMGFKGFVTSDWGMPDGVDMSELAPEDMIPSADKLPSLDSVSEAKLLLDEDKVLAYKMLEKCTEDDLANKKMVAPWAPIEMNLGFWLLQMVEHLNQHKAQLFYYLKIQGKPVNTGHLW